MQAVKHDFKFHPYWCQISNSYHYRYLFFLYAVWFEITGFSTSISISKASISLSYKPQPPSPYKFKRLHRNGQAIRLLELFPGCPSDSIRLSISQKRFTKEDYPEYEALSYCWGSEENPITVEIKASRQCILKGAFWHSKHISAESELKKSSWVTLDIGQNFARALVHLRLETKSRILWVDAICINQRNDDEKSREVRKMGDMYRLATCVVVWLGPASADSSLAVKTLSYLGSQVRLEIERDTNYAADGAEQSDW
jgi:hypothetical protein